MITAKFTADFVQFKQAVDAAEAQLKDFASGAGQVEKSLNRMVDSFSGRKLIQEATVAAKAVEEIGGTSKLTEKELARVGATAQEAAEKMKRLGIDVPPGIQKIADAAKDATKATEGLTIGGVALGVALGEIAVKAAVKLGEVLVDLGKYLVDLTMKGAAIADVEENFQTLTAQAGQLGETLLGALRTGTHNTITDFELMKSVNQNLAAGLNLTEKQFGTLATGAFALAQATGGDVKTAFDTMNDAMLTGRVKGLAMLVTKIDLSAAEEKHAKMLLATSEQLTGEGKLEAARVAILEAVTIATKRLGEQTDGLDEKVSQLDVKWKNFEANLGKTIATSPVLLAGFNALGEAIEQALGAKQGDAIKAIVKVVDQLAIHTLTVGIATTQVATVMVAAYGVMRTPLLAIETVLVGLVATLFTAAAKLNEYAAKASIVTGITKEQAAGVAETAAQWRASAASLLAQTNETARAVVGTSAANKAIDKLGGALFVMRDKMVAANETTAVATGTTKKMATAAELAAAASAKLAGQVDLTKGSVDKAGDATRQSAERTAKFLSDAAIAVAKSQQDQTKHLAKGLDASKLVWSEYVKTVVAANDAEASVRIAQLDKTHEAEMRVAKASKASATQKTKELKAIEGAYQTERTNIEAEGARLLAEEIDRGSAQVIKAEQKRQKRLVDMPAFFSTSGGVGVAVTPDQEGLQDQLANLQRTYGEREVDEQERLQTQIANLKRTYGEREVDEQEGLQTQVANLKRTYGEREVDDQEGLQTQIANLKRTYGEREVDYQEGLQTQIANLKRTYGEREVDEQEGLQTELAKLQRTYGEREVDEQEGLQAQVANLKRTYGEREVDEQEGLQTQVANLQRTYGEREVDEQERLQAQIANLKRTYSEREVDEQEGLQAQVANLKRAYGEREVDEQEGLQTELAKLQRTYGEREVDEQEGLQAQVANLKRTYGEREVDEQEGLQTQIANLKRTYGEREVDEQEGLQTELAKLQRTYGEREVDEQEGLQTQIAQLQRTYGEREVDEQEGLQTEMARLQTTAGEREVDEQEGLQTELANLQRAYGEREVDEQERLQTELHRLKVEAGEREIALLEAANARLVKDTETALELEQNAWAEYYKTIRKGGAETVAEQEAGILKHYNAQVNALNKLTIPMSAYYATLFAYGKEAEAKIAALNFVGPIQDMTPKVKQADDSLKLLADTFVRLGQVSGGSLGKMLGQIGQLVVMLDGLQQQEASGKGSFGQLSTVFDSSASGAARVVAGLAAAGQAYQGYQDLQAAGEAEGTGERLLGSAGAGAKMGAIAGPWGMAVGAAAGLIVGIIKGKPEWQKAAEQVGQDFGVHIDKALSDQIAKDASTFGSIQAGALANLTTIIQQGGGLDTKNFDQMYDRLHDVFSMIEQGHFQAADAAKVLDENFQAFATAATDSTGRLSDEMREIIKLDQEFGTQSKAVADYLQQQGANALTGFTAVVAGTKDAVAGYIALKAAVDAAAPGSEALAMALQEQAAGAATASGALSDLGVQAVASFAAAVASGMSVGDALKVMHPALQTLQQSYQDLGLNVDDVALKNLILQDQIQTAAPALVAAIGGLNAEMVSLSNMGLLNADTFGAMERTGFDMFTRMQDQVSKFGGTQKDALLPMQDYLHQAEQAAKDLGVPLDANTLMMIDQSHQLGIWKEKGKSANDTMMEGFAAIIEALGGTLPKSFEQFSRAALEAADKATGNAHDIADAIAGDDPASLEKAIEAATLQLSTNLPNMTEEGIQDAVEHLAVLKKQLADKTEAGTLAAALAQLGTDAAVVIGGIGSNLDAIPKHLNITVRGTYVPPDMPEPPPYYDPSGAATGGLVTATGIQYLKEGGNVLRFMPRGTDTVPAMLTPGEAVLNVRATKTLGPEAIQALNRGGGENASSAGDPGALLNELKALRQDQQQLVQDNMRLATELADLRRGLPMALRDAVLLAPGKRAA